MNWRIYLCPLVAVFLLSVIWSNALFAQDNLKSLEERNGILIHFSYGGHLTAGDLNKRYGSNFSPGLHLEYLLPNSSLSFGLEGTYQFGRKIKTDVLAPLRNDQGVVLNDNGGFADIVLRKRGFYIGGYGSKFWHTEKEEKWTGWNLKIGAGILQHKLRIQNNSRDVLLLQGEGSKGFDRLTNGMATHLAFGYQSLKKDERVNFYLGAELIAGPTQNRRSWEYDLNKDITESRFDMYYGIRAAWILPFYLSAGDEKIYY